MQDAWLKCFNWIATFVLSIFIDILQVNNNGYISFGMDYRQWMPASFPISQTIIAPFWADSHTSCSGDVYYRETTANSTLAKVANGIQNSLSRSSDFYPSSVVIATWHQVKYFFCDFKLDNKVRIMDVYHKYQLITIIFIVN